MSIKLVVFDFDGTLVDTRTIFLGIVKKNVEKRGFKLDKKFVKDFGNVPLKKAMEFISKDNETLSPIIDDIAKDFIEHAKDVHPCKNLKNLKNLTQEKIILSNSVSDFIEIALEKLNIDFFSEVHGADTFDTKFDELKKIIKRKKLNVDEVIYVGDRPVDIKLARKVGCRVVVVSNSSSWSTKKDLLENGPNFIIGDLKELKTIISKL